MTKEIKVVKASPCRWFDYWLPACTLCSRVRAVYGVVEGSHVKLWFCEECMERMKKAFGEVKDE